MGPITVVEFEYHAGAQRRLVSVTSRVLAIYVMAVLLVELPFVLQIQKHSTSFTNFLQTASVQSIKLPQLNLSPHVKAASTVSMSASEVSASNAALTKLIDNFAHAHSGSFKVAAIDTANPKHSVSYGGDDAMITASTYKMFAAYAALSKVEQGSLSLSTPTANGTLDHCIQRMILVSDNDCGQAVSDKVGWTEMTRVSNAAGFVNTSLDGTRGGNQYSTANDEAQFMYRLQSGRLLNAEHTQYLMDLMKRQILRGGIPAGTNGSVVANKVGNLGTVHADMAVVYSPNSTYVLVIMTDGSSVAAIKDLSQQIYKFYNP